MKFVNSIPFGRFGPRGFCRDEGPYDPLYARGAAPREQVVRLGFCSPHLGALRPSTPGDFPVAGKVTKGAPRASPFGIPWRVVTALAALAAHRAGLPSATEKDRFATLRWWANRSLLFPLALTRKNILLLIRGAGAFSCTFGCNFWGDSGYRWRGFLRGTRHYSATKSGQRSLV